MKILRNLAFGLALVGAPCLAFADVININTADAATLSAALKGVGQSKAEAIVAYRQANGPFTSADDLMKVKGIGEATVERNREIIRLN